jgi:hypothetical protein
MKTVAAFTLALSILTFTPPAQADKLHKVNCDKSQRITEALGKADPGDTIRVTGLCTEQVVIKTDRVTLDGQGTAIVSGEGGGAGDFNAVLTVDGARGVIIKGLTVRNSLANGILALRGASLSVQQTHVRDNALTGISIGGSSTADLTDVQVQGSSPGLDAYTGSTVILHGSIGFTQNAGNGVEINGLAIVEIRGATVSASDNGGVGILVGSGQLAIFGFPSAFASSLTASNNGFAGIVVASSTFTVYPPVPVTISNNGVYGLWLVSGHTFVTALPGSTFLIQENGIGILAEQGASFLFQLGGLTITDNTGAGLLANGAGTLTIRQDPAHPPTISGNTPDIDLRFGTRAVFDGVTFSSVTCDATVLAQGIAGCP